MIVPVIPLHVALRASLRTEHFRRKTKGDVLGLAPADFGAFLAALVLTCR